MNVQRLVVWSVIGIGVSSVTTQLLTLREFLSQFNGNEITISLVLFCWLITAGAGSLLARAVKPSSPAVYAVLILVIALCPLAQLVAIRASRELVFSHGSSPGFYRILFHIAATTAPYCVLTGFALPHAQKVLEALGHPFESGRLYLTDAVGDVMGGALFTFVLVSAATPFVTIAATSTLLIAAALGLLAVRRKFVPGIAAAAAVGLFYFLCLDGAFELRTLARQYGEIVRYMESAYGRVVISREGSQHTFWESGVPYYSDSDIAGAEEKVHYALSQRSRVDNVLLISGGLGGTVGEVAKYAPSHVDYVELDPSLTAAARDLGVIPEAPFLTVINTDGRRYLRTARRRYDAVIVDLPAPDTFQTNRFYTSEFFGLAKSVLVPGGVLCLGVDYSPNYLSETDRDTLSTLSRTARAHFARVRVLPGERAYFLCSDGALSTDVPARLRAAGISTSYVEGFFYGNVSAGRIEWIETSLAAEGPVNRDLRPTLMNTAFRRWFTKHGSSPWYFLAAVSALVGTYLACLRREEYLLFATGCAAMGVEMLVVFAFQVIYGYVYLQIGAIVTVFLLGLLPGAALGVAGRGGGRRSLAASELCMLGLLCVFLWWTAAAGVEPPPVLFLLYCFVFSLLCGFQFPVAAAMIGEAERPAAGCLAADLTGAAVGTVAVGTILIPFAGFRWAVIGLILVKISSIMVTWKREQ